MKSNRICLASFAMLTAFACYAEPSEPMRKLMEAPPSALDVFLFRIHEAAKCGSWLGAEEPPDLCLASIKYTPTTDVVDMHWQMSPVHEDLMDFPDLDDEQREFLLLARLEQVTQLAGVEGRWGLLRSVPLSMAGDAGAETAALRAAIVNRTAVHLHVSYDNTVYSATRDVDGFTELEVTRRDAGDQ